MRKAHIFPAVIAAGFVAQAHAETLVLSTSSGGPAMVELPDALNVVVTAKQIRHLDDSTDRSKQVALLSGEVTIKVNGVAEPVTIKADEIELTRVDEPDKSARVHHDDDNIVAQSASSDTPGVIVFSGGVAIVKATTAGPIQIKADKVVRKEARTA